MPPGFLEGTLKSVLTPQPESQAPYIPMPGPPGPIGVPDRGLPNPLAGPPMYFMPPPLPTAPVPITLSTPVPQMSTSINIEVPPAAGV